MVSFKIELNRANQASVVKMPYIFSESPDQFVDSAKCRKTINFWPDSFPKQFNRVVFWWIWGKWCKEISACRLRYLLTFFDLWMVALSKIITIFLSSSLCRNWVKNHINSELFALLDFFQQNFCVFMFKQPKCRESL